MVALFINVNNETITQNPIAKDCNTTTHPLIAKDCNKDIKLPETIPAPCMLANNPPEIGPTFERPIKPRIDGKNNKMPVKLKTNNTPQILTMCLRIIILLLGFLNENGLFKY